MPSNMPSVIPSSEPSIFPTVLSSETATADNADLISVVPILSTTANPTFAAVGVAQDTTKNEAQVTVAVEAEINVPIIGSMAFIYLFIIIAVLLLCVCLCFGIYCFYSKKQMKQINERLNEIATNKLTPPETQIIVATLSDTTRIPPPPPKKMTVSNDDSQIYDAIEIKPENKMTLNGSINSVGWTSGFIGVGSLPQYRDSVIAEGKPLPQDEEGGFVANVTAQ